MLEIQTPMAPSTLISTRHSPYCPQLPRLKEFGCGLQPYARSPKAPFDALTSNYGHQRSLSDQASSASQPARVPLSSEHWQLRAAPMTNSIVPPYPTPQDSQHDQSQSAGRSEPFYNKYYSAKRSKDSPPRKESERMPTQSSQRKDSNDANTIATHLQIPASINDSKGSLPEFAAQVSLVSHLWGLTTRS